MACLANLLMSAPDGCARGMYEMEDSHSVAGSPFRLRCSLSRPAPIEEIEQAWPQRGLPAEVTELWRVTRAADLFVDADFGEWGLRLL